MTSYFGTDYCFSAMCCPVLMCLLLCLPDEVPDVRECLRYLRGLWPRAAFDDRLPPVVMKHQLYSLCPDRTDVDHQVVSASLSPPTDYAHPPLVPCPLGRTDKEWYYLSVQTGCSSG